MTRTPGAPDAPGGRPPDQPPTPQCLFPSDNKTGSAVAPADSVGSCIDDSLLDTILPVLATTFDEQAVREGLSPTFGHGLHALQSARSAGWLTTYEFEEAIHVHRLCSDDNIHDTAAPHTTSQTYVKLNRAGVRNFARGTLTPPPQRPASANRRRRPSSAGRVRPSVARTGRESSEFSEFTALARD